jgi:hypothetical protein
MKFLDRLFDVVNRIRATVAKAQLKPLELRRTQHTPRDWSLPRTRMHARNVAAKHDRINGRYFLIADLRLDDGSYVPNVEFNGDSRIAVKYFGKRKIVKMLVVCDRSGSRLPEATEAERRAFEKGHSLSS